MRFAVGNAIGYAAALLVLATTAGVPALAQQVGYPPAQSPYRDLTTSQRLTLFGGYYSAHEDVLGVVPNSAPLIGVQYEITVGGPAQFFARLQRASSRRNVYDPTKPQASRSLGTVSDPLYLADIGFSFNLTGQKSWHHLVPTAGFGIGFARAEGSAPADPYLFGTQFAMMGDLGVRYVVSDALELRLGLGNTLYQNHYPSAYYVKGTADTTALLSPNTAKSSYLNNWRLTAGVAFPLFR